VTIWGLWRGSRHAPTYRARIVLRIYPRTVAPSAGPLILACCKNEKSQRYSLPVLQNAEHFLVEVRFAIDSKSLCKQFKISFQLTDIND
jgi:hypothetical protein